MSILKTHFKDFQEKYFIGYSEYKGDRIEFTYRNTFNQWSHSVSIRVVDDKVVFQTYRINAYETLLPYKFTEYAHNKIGCRIPIEEKSLIHEVLTKYDKFKINF